MPTPRDTLPRRIWIGRRREEHRRERSDCDPARERGEQQPPVVVTPCLFEHEKQREEHDQRELAGVERGNAQDRQRRRSERRDTGTIQRHRGWRASIARKNSTTATGTIAIAITCGTSPETAV